MQRLELTWIGKGEEPAVEPRILLHDPSKDYGDPNTPYIAGPTGNVYKNFVCDIPNWEKKLADFPEPAEQEGDFIECVKNRKTHAVNAENGFRSCTVVNLGLTALRLNRTLHFDPVKLEFINDEAANRLLYQPMRAPWSI